MSDASWDNAPDWAEKLEIKYSWVGEGHEPQQISAAYQSRPEIVYAYQWSIKIHGEWVLACVADTNRPAMLTDAEALKMFGDPLDPCEFVRLSWTRRKLP